MKNAKFLVHDQPALRNESDYIARIDLASFGFPDLFEQIWLRRRTDDVGELCCIPFRAYGIALRDVVRISPDGSTVVELMKHSGSRTLRALLSGDLGAEQTRTEAAQIGRYVDKMGLLSEWSGDRHVAIDVPKGVEPARLIEHLELSEGSGRLFWEWSDTAPFTS